MPGQTLSISGGTFIGTAGLSSDASAHGGEALDISLTSGYGSISGGTFIGQNAQNFDGLAMSILSSNGNRMSISGGHFDGDIGLFTSSGGLIDFYGSNLSFTYFGLLGYGMLTGTLQDGATISSKVTDYIEDFTQERSIAGGIEFYSPFAVPEPASVAMMAMGLGATIIGHRIGRSQAGED